MNRQTLLPAAAAALLAALSAVPGYASDADDVKAAVDGYDSAIASGPRQDRGGFCAR